MSGSLPCLGETCSITLLRPLVPQLTLHLCSSKQPLRTRSDTLAADANCLIALARGDEQMAMQQNTSIDSDHGHVIASLISSEVPPLANQTLPPETADGNAEVAQSGQRPPLRRIPRWAWYSTGCPLACRWDLPGSVA
jgi:hypothetical protein